MVPFLYDSAFLSIQTVWVFAIIAMLSCSYLAIQRLKRTRVNFTLFIEHIGFFLLCSIIAARITFFVLHTDTYFPGFDLRTLKSLFSLWDQGFSFWGGLIGFMIAFLYRIKRSEENTWKWLDALIVPLIIGLGIGSFGNFLGGNAYGSPTDLPWGIKYAVFSVKYTVPVHPVQLYEIFFLISLLWSKRKIQKRTAFFEREGNATVYYCTFLSLGLFGLEFLRGDDTLMILGIRLPIILFCISFLASAWTLYRRIKAYKHPNHEPQPV